MLIDNTLTAEELHDIDVRIKLKRGEKLTITIPALEEVVGEDDEVQEVVVNHSLEFYVGKMTPKVTSGVISIIGAIFVNGSNFKEATGRTDNLTFIDYLDEYHLTLLLALILDTPRAWVVENWDLTGWVMDVLGTFFRYNNFFDLVQAFTKMLENSGLTQDQARDAALGTAKKSK